MRLWALLKLCIGCFLFGLTESWFLGRRSFDVSPVVTTTQEPTTPSKIWRTARSKIGSMDWSKLNKWRWNRRYINGWKCNLFVYDVLLESGAEAPNRRMIGHNPIGANEWANPQSGFVLATGCYRNVPFENRIKGDIIAFRSNYGSGHMGIVSTNGNYISALRQMIEENSVQDFLETQSTIDRTTVWRYTCGQGEFGLEETSDESTRTESPVANRQFRVMPGFYFRIRF